MNQQQSGANKRALVTGAAGFTGRYLVQELEQHGWEVWGVGHAPQQGLANYRVADLEDYAQLQSAVQEIAPHAVFHLAAIAFVGHGSPVDFYRVNVGGSRNLLQALASLKQVPESVLLASSANVYGNTAEGKLSEATPLNPANEIPSPAALDRLPSHRRRAGRRAALRHPGHRLVVRLRATHPLPRL